MAVVAAFFGGMAVQRPHEKPVSIDYGAEMLRRFSGAEHNLALEQPLDNQSLGAVGQCGWESRQQSPEEIVAALERCDQLEVALNWLPADERQIVVWRQFEELTFIEIAARLRWSRQVVDRAFRRAFTR
jgi:RNA polymerase sigma factor (sigma-70 family)